MFLRTSSAFPNAEKSQEIFVIVFWVSFFCALYVGSSSSAAAAADNQGISLSPNEGKALYLYSLSFMDLLQNY